MPAGDLEAHGAAACECVCVCYENMKMRGLDLIKLTSPQSQRIFFNCGAFSPQVASLAT